MKRVRRPAARRALDFIRRKTDTRFAVLCYTTPLFNEQEQVIAHTLEVNIGQDIGLSDAAALRLSRAVDAAIRGFLWREGLVQ